METGLAIVALLLGLGGIGIGLKAAADARSLRGLLGAAAADVAQARDQVAALSGEAAAARAGAAAAVTSLRELHAAFVRLQDEVAVLRAELPSVAPPPPLPQARTRSLDDLRERLRAEQQSGSDEDDD